MKKSDLKINQTKTLITISALAGSLVFILGSSLGAQEIIVSSDDAGTENPLVLEQIWTLTDKIAEKEDWLNALPLKASTNSLDFNEIRIAVSSAGKIST